MTQHEPKFVKTVAVVSIITDVMLCEFGEVHRAVEVILGRPVYNVMLGDREFMGKLRWIIMEQLPGLPRELEGVTKENWREHALRIEGQFGEYVSIHEGTI